MSLVEKILREGLGNSDVIKAIDEIKSQAKINPYDPSELVLGDEKCGVDIRIVKDMLYISSLTAYEKGGGRFGMDLILKIADKYQVKVRLKAVPYGKKTLNKSQLKNWYNRLGFISTGQDDEMIREPK